MLDEGRAVAAGLAYRRWALDHRSQFLLLLGVPRDDYAAPEGGPTTAAASRLGSVFHEVLFAGWTADELAGVPLRVRSTQLEDAFASHVSEWPTLPPGPLPPSPSGGPRCTAW
ncbi:MAG: WHG domain-containing protein [Nocardioides sp.]|nr:WHG domain-containing protein [Nocardioides sp.]